MMNSNLFVVLFLCLYSFSVAVNPNCNCVVFRLDDIQDWWITTPQKAVMDVFKESLTPLAVGIIANKFGEDPNIVNYVRDQTSVPGWNFEVTSHGWNHESFDTFTKAQQKTFLSEGRTKIYNSIGQNVSYFIPPYNAFNSNTIAALQELGYKGMTSMVAMDPAPYNYPPSSFYRWPIGASTATDDFSNIGATALSTFNDIVSQINSYGFASVMMHPQEHSILVGGSPGPNANTVQLDVLRSLIAMVKAHGINIVTYRDLPFAFPQTTSPITSGRAASTTAQTVSTTAQPVSITTSQVVTSGTNCNCVVFRLDDVQDWWITDAQKAVMNVFKEELTPLAIGIIANYFGEDTSMVNFVKTQLQTPGWNLEVTNHGWNHEYFDSFTKAQQKTKLSDGIAKTIATLTPTISNINVFIPPYNAFNSNTLAALQELGFQAMTSNVVLDPSPYNYPPSSFYRWPVGASTAVSDNSNVGVSALTTFNAIVSQINSFGFASVMMHPQEHCVLDSGGNPTSSVNTAQINSLRTLIAMVKAQGIKIVTYRDLPSEFTSSSASTTAARVTTGTSTTGRATTGTSTTGRATTGTSTTGRATTGTSTSTTGRATTGTSTTGRATTGTSTTGRATTGTSTTGRATTGTSTTGRVATTGSMVTTGTTTAAGSSSSSGNSWAGEGSIVVTQDAWGYCATVQIKNTGSVASSGWLFQFTRTGSATVGTPWSCNSAVSGNNYQMTHLSWNNVVNPGATFDGVGFCGSGQFTYSSVQLTFYL